MREPELIVTSARNRALREPHGSDSAQWCQPAMFAQVRRLLLEPFVIGSTSVRKHGLLLGRRSLAGSPIRGCRALT
jgi:hypothetical protein